ncbi:diguanylate phosphodiesterase [Oceaniovalibus guishaninsula JLT2003]|uniref:Diguanylate phosphodiesterase n=1 Tax=Oceaniovalibus guishaninsula JLT2003 TaxID=1231392 RepID=K2HMR0_9RHOB|nr:EAL domain-containing protein [Oceaniovalibus guishaninsula]EKE44119.1 diguanylate phosphodiesterase [Oceaniovalibus guishaninsula JLT2003]
MKDVSEDPGTTDPVPFVSGQRDDAVLAMVERAVADHNVMLAFQPVVPAGRHDRPAFYEGLIRILDARGRIIPAKDFILQVECLELGRRIDCLSLECGLRVLRENPRLRLAINMSARSIDHPGWLAVLEDGLRDDPTIGERLILEITESSAIQMPDAVQAFMTRLQARGISFAIDDFGSGYTSMRYLKDLRFDILKIDGQFIRGIARSADNQALVKAIVSIGRHFDMVTIAEFVETAEDAKYLGQIGVDCLQGYYFGAPTIRPRWEPCREERAG